MSNQKDKSSKGAEGTNVRPELIQFPLHDELVIFSPEAQCLVGLNASAAFVFRQLQQGTPKSELANALVSEGLASPSEAESWAAMTLEALGSHGLLTDGQATALSKLRPFEEDLELAAHQIYGVPPYEPVDIPIERRYRLLETCALVRFTHSAQLRLVEAVIGHLTTDARSEPDVVIEIQGIDMKNGHLHCNIYRDGKPFGFAPRMSAVGPIVKFALWQSAVNAHDFRFYIHAGVVGTGQTCIVLPAAAGSGKSSITTALIHSGYGYYSDEVALVEGSNFHVAAVPLAICSKRTGWKVIARYYPELEKLPIHRRFDGRRVRYFAPPAGALQQAPARVSHIIFPRYEKDSATEIRPLARSEALGRLMKECVVLRDKLNKTNVGELVDWIAATECYDLTFSSLDDAVALIKSVAPPIKI